MNQPYRETDPFPPPDPYVPDDTDHLKTILRTLEDCCDPIAVLRAAAAYRGYLIEEIPQ